MYLKIKRAGQQLEVLSMASVIRLLVEYGVHVEGKPRDVFVVARVDVQPPLGRNHTLLAAFPDDELRAERLVDAVFTALEKGDPTFDVNHWIEQDAARSAGEDDPEPATGAVIRLFEAASGYLLLTEGFQRDAEREPRAALRAAVAECRAIFSETGTS